MNTLASRPFVQHPARRLASGAVVPHDYRPPEPKGIGLETCRGALIVGAVQPAPTDMGSHAEHIQATLLARRRTPDFIDASSHQDTLHERMQEPVRELPPWLGFFLICGVVGAAYVVATWVFAGPPQIEFNPWSR